ncbi:MAG: LysR family transcriptional regulator [Pyrinomonadaceae bacterium]
MELSQLRAFTIVAETSSFTRAAELLEITQPAVSRQIKALEDDLGYVLVQRKKRNVTLTREGEVALCYAKQILREYASLERDIEGEVGERAPYVRIAAIMKSFSSPFVYLRRRWREAFPDLELKLENARVWADIENGILTGRVDVGFAINQYVIEGLESVPHSQFEMLLVAGADADLDFDFEYSLADLKDLPWFLFEENDWPRIEVEKIFAAENFEPANVYDSNDGAVLVSLIKNEAGLGFLPEWAILDELSSGRLKRIKWKGGPIVKTIYLLFLKELRSKHTDTFVEFLLKNSLPGVKLYPHKDG